MQESIKRTRIEIVASGLGFLIGNNSEGITRKQFFLLDPKEINRFDIKKLSAVAKANASKNWHSGVLDRLISDGLLKKVQKTNGLYYQIDNYELSEHVFKDFKSGNGLLLSHYIYPKEVPSAVDGPASVALSVLDQKIDPDQQELSVEFLMGKILANLIHIKGEQEINYKAIVSSITELKNNDAILNKINIVEQKANGTNKRIEEQTNIIKDLHSLVEASQTTTKNLLSSVVDIRNISENLNKIVISITDAMRQVNALSNNVNELTTEIKDKEKSDVASLAKRVQNSLVELQTLSSEMLEVTSKLEKNK